MQSFFALKLLGVSSWLCKLHVVTILLTWKCFDVKAAESHALLLVRELLRVSSVRLQREGGRPAVADQGTPMKRDDPLGASWLERTERALDSCWS